MNEFSLYFRYLRLNFLGGLQYQGWPLQMVGVFFTAIIDPIAVLILFSRFGAVGSWTADRVMLVYGLALTSFGFAELFSRGFDTFPWQIRTGAFDRILLRPRSTFLQVLGLRFQLNRLARVVSGLCLVGWSLVVQGVSLSFWHILQLLFALAGGYLVYTGVFVIASAIAFWTIEAVDWIYIFTNGSYQVAKVPPEFLPPWLRRTFTFFMPMLVCSYWPAAVVCGWGVSPLLGWLPLPAGVAFLGLALAAWRLAIRQYASTGS
ncbi:MAG: hypothetical protein GX060_06045 [Firmicutes bacterium]|nr:hypothetical protein [Bacillota bacterium]